MRQGEDHKARSPRHTGPCVFAESRRPDRAEFHRFGKLQSRALSSEVGTGSREESASKQESRASALIQSEPKMLSRGGVADLSQLGEVGRDFAAMNRKARVESRFGLIGCEPRNEVAFGGIRLVPLDFVLKFTGHDSPPVRTEQVRQSV